MQLRSYLDLLAATPDDPTDCITTAIMHRIFDLEKMLIVLEIDGLQVKPDWVLSCNSVDLHNGSCKGPELDTTFGLPEEGMATRLHEKVPRSALAVLRLEDGYQAKILGAFGDSGSGLAPLNMKGDKLMVGRLEKQTDHPSVTVILWRDDSLRYRKVVWHLYPLQSAGATVGSHDNLGTPPQFSDAARVKPARVE